MVAAKAAWLDILDENEVSRKTLYFKINNSEKQEVLSGQNGEKIQELCLAEPLIEDSKAKCVAELRHDIYKTILVVPIGIQGKRNAILYILKDVNEGFTREMIEIVRTFINQSSISIENYRLMQQAIKNERYKEELKIAKRVQDSLIPKVIDINQDLEISGRSKAATEVGGDYFDTFKIDDHRLAVIIGDVSGKGTSAAFHMSQMKGVFQSLVQLKLSAQEFMIKANNALGISLDRTSFITASFFILDSKSKTFEFSRAGHCPTLYYCAKEKDVMFLEDHGLGLGILRDDQFNKYIDVNKKKYQSGDILFLYTDGITEAKNLNGDEFGYERLQEFLKKNAYYSADYIKEEIFKTLYDFCGSTNLEDDVTTLIIKVK